MISKSIPAKCSILMRTLLLSVLPVWEPENLGTGDFQKMTNFVLFSATLM